MLAAVAATTPGAALLRECAMAEQVQRHRQYEYRANSNLVLTTEHARGSRSEAVEAEPSR